MTGAPAVDVVVWILDTGGDREAAHGLVRAALATRLGIDPAAVAIEVPASGKPRLAAGHGGPDVRFNLSHSGDLAVVALADGHEVGVDVEARDRRRDVDRLAPRVLGDDERAALDATPPGDRLRTFLDAWTRKEAILKAAGEGVHARPLTDVRVSLEPGARFEAALDDRRFTVADLDMARGFSGAIAVEGLLGDVAVQARA